MENQDGNQLILQVRLGVFVCVDKAALCSL